MRCAMLSSVTSALAAVVFLAAAPSAQCADAAKKPASLEEQTAVLESALAEALRTGDWKMLDLAVQGFKALGKKGPDLEMAVLRAERQAALESMMAADFRRVQIEVWGLASRAKLGDAKALDSLRALAASKVSIPKAPDWATFKDRPAEMAAAQKAYGEAIAEASRRDCALLCLAMNKEPGVLDRVLACLREPGDDGRFHAQNPLVAAAIAADPEKGLNALLDICKSQDKDISIRRRIAVFSVLASLVPKDGEKGLTAFTISADIGAAMPKDAGARLAKAFAEMAKRQDLFENGLPYQFLTLARVIPKLGENPEAVAAISSLKGKAPGNAAQMWDAQVDAVLSAVLKGKGVPPIAPPPEKF
ncbi:MAG: hypothetical protein N3A38_14920 [Planctomycetota bacterium]|nr:hypothetical protein [Planctomycetota bacterium]